MPLGGLKGYLSPKLEKFLLYYIIVVNLNAFWQRRNYLCRDELTNLKFRSENAACEGRSIVCFVCVFSAPFSFGGERCTLFLEMLHLQALLFRKLRLYRIFIHFVQIIGHYPIFRHALFAGPFRKIILFENGD